MALKAILASLEGVPEAIQALYTEVDGKFVLDLDAESIKDHPSTAPLANALAREKEDRRKAREEAKALEDKVATFKDIDPEKAREAMAQLAELADKELLDAGKVDEVVEQRLERAKADFEARVGAKDKLIEDTQAQLAALNDRLSEVTIFTAIKDAAVQRGVRETALDDVVNRSRATWKLGDDGQPVASKANGEPDYGTSGEAITITEWVDGLATAAPHLFKESSGGGSQGGGEQRGGKVVDLSQPNAIGNNLEAIASGAAVAR